MVNLFFIIECCGFTFSHYQKEKKKKGTEFKNCKELSFSSKDKNRVQIQWEKDRNVVKFKVSARITELQYVALGKLPKFVTRLIRISTIIIRPITKLFLPTQTNDFKRNVLQINNAVSHTQLNMNEWIFEVHISLLWVYDNIL